MVHKSPFLRQKERSEHFGLKINFVGQKKLNKHGVLKIHFFQNPRRYKSCPKTCETHTKNIHPQILTHHMGNKWCILYLVLRSPIMFITVHDYHLGLFCHFFKKPPCGWPFGPPGVGASPRPRVAWNISIENNYYLID